MSNHFLYLWYIICLDTKQYLMEIGNHPAVMYSTIQSKLANIGTLLYSSTLVCTIAQCNPMDPMVTLMLGGQMCAI